MGGLLASWDNFHDEANSVTRPAQMGPVWMHAGLIANRPIAHQIWMKDPPASSYPACIAVKCAQLQSDMAGENMLHLLSEAGMVVGRNTAKQSVIFDVAEKLANLNPEFSAEQFKRDYQDEKGIEPLRADLALVRSYHITRFPTLIIKGRDDKAIITSGYREYSEILKAMEAVVPGVSNDHAH